MIEFDMVFGNYILKNYITFCHMFWEIFQVC